MKALITGSLGFVGGYLRKELEANGYDVTGVDIRPGEKTIQADLTKAEDVLNVVRTVQPDIIIHLAGQASVARSWEIPQKTFEINVICAINLMEAVELANLPDMRINAMVATGDLIANTTETTALDASLYLSGFNTCFYSANQIPSFFCTGNHDANMLTDHTSYYLSKQDLHRLLFAKTNYPIHQPAGENYFYADVPNPMGGTIRIISLDNTDQEGFDYKSLNRSCITQQQVDWFIQTALRENMTDQYSVIVLNHHPLQPFSKDLSTYMCSGTHLYGARLIPDIVNAFIQKKTWKQTYKTNTAPYQTLSVEADFTDVPGEFICYMGGHTHTPAHFEVPCNDATPAKQIMLLANTLSPDLQNNTYCYIKRKKDDITSNSFSIYAIDTQEKNIYITYFGAKSNATPTIETVSYR